MPLPRITLATDTLQDFTALTSAKQKILIFLLSNRSMHERPACPTRYFSYKAIADETGLKETTVRVLIISLTKEGWLTRENQRVKYTPAGEPETQFKWCAPKVTDALQKSYETDEDEIATYKNEVGADQFLHEGKIWRVGGSLGWEYKKEHSRNGMWVGTLNVPDAVVDFFS